MYALELQLSEIFYAILKFLIKLEILEIDDSLYVSLYI
jgi:hypothetical protein